MSQYSPRIADTELAKSLQRAGAVLVEGAKASGKTETAKQVAASSVMLDTDIDAIELLSLNPERVLAGASPRLIDEWQLEPAVWNHVRRAVDDRKSLGQFILTGSAVPADDATRHSGAGRFARLRMRPMSLREVGFGSASVSLQELMSGIPADGPKSTLELDELVERMVVGGWPGSQSLSAADAVLFSRDYLDQVARVDLPRVDGVRRDPNGVAATIAALAKHTAREVSATTLAADAGGRDGAISRQTVTAYLDALSRSFVIEDQPAWGPHLRARSILRGAPKRHFVDPSLAVAALKANPSILLKDLSLLGLLFESLVVRDLRVYAQPINGEIFHYRDNTGLEVDAVIQTIENGWGACEIKLNHSRVDEGAASLRRLVTRVDEARMGPPAFLAVITGGGYAYRRKDGVDVVPIGALGP